LFLLANSRFQILRQGIKLQFPERAVLLHPRSRILHRLCSQSATVNTAIDFAFEQARGFQDAHVFRDRWQRNAEGPRKFRDHGFALREADQNRAARGVCKRAKRSIQRHGRIVNHTV
jgi:hypothetical protein